MYLSWIQRLVIMLARTTLASTAIVLLPGLSNAFSYPDCVNGPLASNLVCDPQAPQADRAAALVTALNITEKLSLLIKYVLSLILRLTLY